MKIIRASEVGTYHFCQRAWWYQLQGYEPENKAEMVGGNELHKKHGTMVMASGCILILAYTALMLAILSTLIWLLSSIL
ncbi:MAG: hypothetical protein A2136_07840 [Chloroflexi bacterium RBG_16_54_11]|nr:MAG: hypothetical protein A2136_07840 [Chloroflexi bacterium RBG_16_54_11]